MQLPGTYAAFFSGILQQRFNDRFDLRSTPAAAGSAHSALLSGTANVLG